MTNAFVPPSFGASSFTSANVNHFTSSFSSPIHPAAVSVPLAARVHMSAGNILIVNTKGGGHGHIGFHLAEKLLADGHKVHIHQVGNETCSTPVTQYPALASKYGSDMFSVAYDSSVPATFPSSDYTAIYDNNAKSLEDIAPVVATAKQSGAQMFYVSSAGAYKYDANSAPHETVNAASGPTIDVENAIIDAGVCSANFRPIYIIGPHTSKREYVDFFFDRLVRNRPVPLPGSGFELTSISDVRDIAGLLASAVGKTELKDQTINAVNTRAVTFDAMTKLCAEACGVDDPKIVHYDPSKMEKSIEGFKVKKAFPFRPRHFFASTIEAQLMLGWQPSVAGTMDGLSQSIKECYDEYVKLGLDKADVDFSLDDKILASL